MVNRAFYPNKRNEKGPGEGLQRSCGLIFPSHRGANRGPDGSPLPRYAVLAASHRGGLGRWENMTRQSTAEGPREGEGSWPWLSLAFKR